MDSSYMYLLYLQLGSLVPRRLLRPSKIDDHLCHYLSFIWSPPPLQAHESADCTYIGGQMFVYSKYLTFLLP